MAKIYKKSKDLGIMELYYGYTNMRKEIRSLSKLVKKQLGEYDYQIIESYAVLADYIINGPPPPNGGGGGCSPGLDDCFFACTLFIDIGCFVWNIVICAIIGAINYWGGLVCAILFGLLCLYPPMTYEECIYMCIDVYCN